MIPGTYGSGDAGVTDENVEMNVKSRNMNGHNLQQKFHTHPGRLDMSLLKTIF
jgi:hypothetical protein